MRSSSRACVAVLMAASIAAACSAPSSDSVETTSSVRPETGDIGQAATEPPATDLLTEPAESEASTNPVTAPEAAPTDPSEVGLSDEILDPALLVAALASDDLNGRDNQSAGSEAARELLVDLLSEFADPATEGPEGFLHPYDVGTNIIGIVPGSGDLASEHVVIGAHYDHFAPGQCDTLGELDDVICNGAADNAAGVASVMTAVGRLIADGFDDEVDRRSIVVAFWDGEEDGLIGSRYYGENPVVPFESTVAYLNIDLQGASLLPSLDNHTLVIGPETGGPALIGAVARATQESPVDFATLSLAFGQGRSDHAVFFTNGVPAVFFSDWTNGCYHTVLDDVDHYDADKHLMQVAVAEALVRDLAITTELVALTPGAAPTGFADAEAWFELLSVASVDFELLPDGGVSAGAFLTELELIVDAGPDSFDEETAWAVLERSWEFTGTLADVECLRP